jgi:hypothetical protein
MVAEEAAIIMWTASHEVLSRQDWVAVIVTRLVIDLLTFIGGFAAVNALLHRSAKGGIN